MNKNIKILLGVLVIGAVGYYIYQQNQKPKIFANANGRKKNRKKNADGTPKNCMRDEKGEPIVVTGSDGKTYYKLKSGNLLPV